MAATAAAAAAAVEDAEPSALTKLQDVVPLTTRVLISNFKVAYNLLRRPDGSFDRFLAEFLDRKVSANPTPVDRVATRDVFIDRATGLWGRIFWPADDAGWQGADQAADGEARDVTLAMPLLIYFHGGSFVHSSANSAIYDTMCRLLAKMCRTVILSVNFRRAPEHRYPVAYDDGLASVRWALGAQTRQWFLSLGCCPSKCFLAGDSSGGNIAHNVSVRATQEGMKLSGMFLLMPMFGGQQRTPAEKFLDGKYFVTMNDRDWYWRAFLPADADRKHPACNPFAPTAPSLSGLSLPPCLVVIGGLDILQDWQLNYVYSMRRAGKPVQLLFLEQATMGFFLLPNTDLFYALVERLRQFLCQG